MLGTLYDYVDRSYGVQHSFEAESWDRTVWRVGGPIPKLVDIHSIGTIYVNDRHQVYTQPGPIDDKLHSISAWYGNVFRENPAMRPESIKNFDKMYLVKYKEGSNNLVDYDGLIGKFDKNGLEILRVHNIRFNSVNVSDESFIGVHGGFRDAMVSFVSSNQEYSVLPWLKRFPKSNMSSVWYDQGRHATSMHIGLLRNPLEAGRINGIRRRETFASMEWLDLAVTL